MRPDVTAVDRLISRAGLTGVEVDETPAYGVVCTCAPSRAGRLIAALKGEDDGFDFLVDLFGVDTGEDVEVVYHLRSFSRDDELYVRVTYPYGSELESVWEAHPAALMPERECAEMFGLTLSGHPNPKHLLLTEGSLPLLLKKHPIRTAEEVRDR